MTPCDFAQSPFTTITHDRRADLSGDSHPDTRSILIRRTDEERKVWRMKLRASFIYGTILLTRTQLVEFRQRHFDSEETSPTRPLVVARSQTLTALGAAALKD